MTMGPDFPEPPAVSARARAFMRRIREALRGQRDPRYAIVVLDIEDDGEEGAYNPHLVMHGNRTDAVFAAAQLLAAAIDMERNQRCPCESCDDASLRARKGLAALGVTFQQDGKLQ